MHVFPRVCSCIPEFVICFSRVILLFAFPVTVVVSVRDLYSKFVFSCIFFSCCATYCIVLRGCFVFSCVLSCAVTFPLGVVPLESYVASSIYNLSILLPYLFCL